MRSKAKSASGGRKVLFGVGLISIICVICGLVWVLPCYGFSSSEVSVVGPPLTLWEKLILTQKKLYPFDQLIKDIFGLPPEAVPPDEPPTEIPAN